MDLCLVLIAQLNRASDCESKGPWVKSLVLISLLTKKVIVFVFDLVVLFAKKKFHHLYSTFSYPRRPENFHPLGHGKFHPLGHGKFPFPRGLENKRLFQKMGGTYFPMGDQNFFQMQ